MRSHSPKQTADAKGDDHHQNGICLDGGLQSDENDHQAHGLHDRAAVLIRDAAPEKKPEETAGYNGQSIYNGTQHKNRPIFNAADGWTSTHRYLRTCNVERYIASGLAQMPGQNGRCSETRLE
jgi:hypothetical protein